MFNKAVQCIVRIKSMQPLHRHGPETAQPSGRAGRRAQLPQASERVHLSQPAFSRSIQAAEEELGMQLFDRSGAQVACTPAGAFVIERAGRVLLESRRLERDVHLFSAGKIGEVSFGAGPMATAALLPALMTD